MISLQYIPYFFRIIRVTVFTKNNYSFKHVIIHTVQWYRGYRQDTSIIIPLCSINYWLTGSIQNPLYDHTTESHLNFYKHDQEPMKKNTIIFS